MTFFSEAVGAKISTFPLCGCRVRGMLISPEVRNAIHVGDRILEINGLPVGSMTEEEVPLLLLLSSLFL